MPPSMLAVSDRPYAAHWSIRYGESAWAARFLGGGQPVTIVNPGGRPAMDLRMIEPLENMRDLQSVNAKQRVGGVDAERSAPHISGVTPAMRRLAERRGIVPVDDRGCFFHFWGRF